MVMALQAGLLNMGGFMACHRFVSHVTGFATFMGYEIGQSHIDQALGLLAVPALFLIGSMISGQLVDIRLKLHKAPKYYLAFGVVFALILTVLIGGIFGFFGRFGEPMIMGRDYLLLAFLCLSCGIQNGTITSVSKSVVRTTHLTGITTDLGIGLTRVLNRDKLPGSVEDDIRANSMRIGIIIFFGLGSVIGAFGFRHWGYAGFAVPAVTSGSLFGLMLYFQIFKVKPVSQLKNDKTA
jgi:uncharacterized membrane protein YoaK (UPF0700 family)